MIRLIGGRFQHRLERGFSSSQGICCFSHSSIMAKHARKRVLPTLMLKYSFSDKNLLGIPHGKRWFLITLVLSLAREKLVQTGAIITARTLPRLISWSSLFNTRLSVKSCSGPWIMSHCFAWNPSAWQAALTPPLPANRSITYLCCFWRFHTRAPFWILTWFPQGFPRIAGSVSAGSSGGFPLLLLGEPTSRSEPLTSRPSTGPFSGLLLDFGIHALGRWKVLNDGSGTEWLLEHLWILVVVEVP